MSPHTRRKVEFLADILVVGYGNTMRRDDGVGPVVADRIEALRLPRVWTLALPQLAPEHGECLSRVRDVIFVDASVDVPDGPQLRPLEPATSARITSRVLNAPTLMAVARDLFGRTPRGWIITIGGSDFRSGYELSPDVTAAIEQAVAIIQDFVRSPPRR